MNDIHNDDTPTAPTPAIGDRSRCKVCGQEIEFKKFRIDNLWCHVEGGKAHGAEPIDGTATPNKTELEKLEASFERYDLMEPDEVDSEEYQRILKRIVELREQPTVPTPAALIAEVRQTLYFAQGYMTWLDEKTNNALAALDQLETEWKLVEIDRSNL